ncbi:thermonuclease family protein [Pasteurella canis]|uniref:thermonuclease family protein n=1 Tax=Pasteurella canis TaxID=753 RepID=UPI0013254704|nr:thermonuclease family protein [Pasteurella canis]MXN88780.1 nuclease [Pasteurella canis]UAX42606.1 thermonuclease family protein [Pasteurella canis]
MYKKKAFIAFYCLLLSYAAEASHTLHCKVVSISDGDTFNCLLKNNKQLRVRLWGIDAPERNQAFGQKAKQFLGKLIHKKQVKLAVTGYDQYQRTLAEVYTLQGKNINVAIVKAGMAWVYKKYNAMPIYLQAQHKAKQQNLGLWQDPHPIEPEKWRKQKRIAQ